MRGGRTLEAARVALGLAELTGPGLLADGVLHQTTDPRARAVIRVLGGRHLVQGAVTLSVGRPAAHAVGGGVDGLHALSMLALAALDRRHRTLALASATVAGTFAALEMMVSRRR